MRFNALALLSIFLIGATSARPSVRLNDVSGYGAQQAAIVHMVSQGIMSPVKGGIFNPAGSVTRGDFAVMLQRLFRLKPGRLTGYTDISVKDPRYGAIAAAAPYMNRQVFCFGCELTTNFQPNKPLTQGEATVFVVRILAAQGKVRPLTAAQLKAAYALAPDAAKSNALMAPLLAVGVTHHVVPVQPGVGILPAATLTRARAAVLLDNTQRVKAIRP